MPRQSSPTGSGSSRSHYINLPGEKTRIFYHIHRAGLVPDKENEFSPGVREEDHQLGIDMSKPTILMVHPLGMGSIHMQRQYGCAELRERYNIVTFDLRYHGRSQSEPNESYDAWVAAAEAATVVAALNVNSVHLFACCAWGCTVAMRFAALFPHRVLSCTLDGTPWIGKESEDAKNVYGALSKAWMEPRDEDEVHEVIDEFLWFKWGGKAHLRIDEYDYLAGILLRDGCPKKAPDVFMWVTSLLERPDFPAEAYADIRVPVMILRGEEDAGYPVEAVNHLTTSLVNAKVTFEEIPGAAYVTSFTHSEPVNKLLLDFFSTAPADSPFPFPSDEFAHALQRLARFSRQPPIASRKPGTHLLNFGVRTPQEKSVIKQQIAESKRIASLAFSVRGQNTPDPWDEMPDNERLAWRFSERDEGHPDRPAKLGDLNSAAENGDKGVLLKVGNKCAKLLKINRSTKTEKIVC